MRCVALCALLLMSNVSRGAEPKLTGTFFGGWTGAQSREWWTRELGDMRALGFDTIIFQHATYGDPGECLYGANSLSLKSPQGDVYGPLLEAADAQGGWRIFLGLGYRTDWKYDGSHTLAEYESLATFNITVADDLWKAYGRFHSVAGWYIPQELDSENTWAPASAAPGTPMGRLLDGYYRPVIAHMKHLFPGGTIAIAPFFGYNAMPPPLFTDWWATLLAACPVDLIMMQDGVGAFHATLSFPAKSGETPPLSATEYLAATSAACARAKKSFWVDLEIFCETGEDSFEPGSLEAHRHGARWYPGLRAQLLQEAPVIAAGGPHGDKIVCYEYLENMSLHNENNQPAAANLHRAYAKLISASARKAGDHY